MSVRLHVISSCINYILPLDPRWIGEAVFIVEIRKDELTANQREVVEYYIKHEVYMYNLDNLAADIGMTFAIGVVFRIIAYSLLRLTKRSRQR